MYPAAWTAVLTLGHILCRLGRHNTFVQETRNGPAPGFCGGFVRWQGFRRICRRCGKVTGDWTYPSWATKEECEQLEGKPFTATWAEGTKP